MAVTPFVSDIEMNKNIIFNPCFHMDSEGIRNPKDGQYYLNTTDNKVYFYRTNDHQWHKLGDNSIIYTAGRGIEISNENVISVVHTIFDDIENNRRDILDIIDDIEDIEENAQELNDKIDRNTSRIISLEEWSSQTNSKINTINSNITDIYGQISSINGTVQTNSRNIASNTSEITSLKTRMSTAEGNITTNTSDINGLKTRMTTAEGKINTAEGNITSLQGNVSDLSNGKLDKNFTSKLVTDVSLVNTTTNVKIKETKIDPSTREITTEENTIPIANTTQNGLATSEMVNTIASNVNRIAVLEQRGGHFIGRSFATVADLQQYTIPDTVNVGDFTYVIDDENHENATTQYIVILNNNSRKEFRFAYVIDYDPVGLFTKNTPGLIKGSLLNGRIKAEANGEGSVIGWDTLSQSVSDNTSAITDLRDDFDDIIGGDMSQLLSDVNALKTTTADHTSSILSLNTNKADKSKLQSIVTDFTLSISADQENKDNVYNLIKTKYNALTDTVTTSNVLIPLSNEDMAGLISAQDKEKLDNISPGAEVNQNAFNNIQVGANNITASSKTDSFQLEAGTGISLDVTPSTKKIKINSTISPVNTVATWQDNGLQSAYDKEREDKMGEEIWEAVMDNNGNYTIDVGNFTGYVGNNSHMFVRFMQDNINDTFTLRVISSTGGYTLINAARVYKYNNVPPEKRFILAKTIWELVYDSDNKFYIVAGAGSSVSKYGYNDLAPVSNKGKILAKGRLEPNSSVSILMEVTAMTNDDTSATGLLEIQVKSNATNLDNVNGTFLRWISKSSNFDITAKTVNSPIDQTNTNLLKNSSFFLNYALTNSLDWKLVMLDTSVPPSYVLQYRVLSATDPEANEPVIDLYKNLNETITGVKNYSTYDKVTSPENANYQINSIMKVTQAEFNALTAANKIIPGMLYNVLDDQLETHTILTVTDYNTLNPVALSMYVGELAMIKSPANSNFIVNSASSTGIIMIGNNSATILCRNEASSTDNLYFRSYRNGSWGNWQKVATATDFNAYVRSSDSSIKDMKTVTQADYDAMLLSGTTDSKTIYNITDNNGDSIVSRINEYTDLSQLGITKTTNMNPTIILSAMSDNSILYAKLVAGEFTLQSCTVTNGIAEFVKLDSSHFYVRVTEQKSTSDLSDFYIYD